MRPCTRQSCILLEHKNWQLRQTGNVISTRSSLELFFIACVPRVFLAKSGNHLNNNPSWFSQSDGVSIIHGLAQSASTPDFFNMAFSYKFCLNHASDQAKQACLMYRTEHGQCALVRGRAGQSLIDKSWKSFFDSRPGHHSIRSSSWTMLTEELTRQSSGTIGPLLVHSTSKSNESKD